MTLDDIGITIQLSRDADGTPVVNVVGAASIYLERNGNLVHGQAQRQVRQTYWNADGTQNTTGTVDLRGEVRG